MSKKLENLKKGKKFEKGDPRINRTGRPKGTENSKTRLLRLLALTQIKKNPVTGKDEEFSVMEQMDMALVIKALKGDVTAYREILDRAEGKPMQKNINLNKVGVEAEEEKYLE